eukprot:CAMPEP_0194153884 /NCGR_PEP_ID=MMETSP0152-20130528/58324_1 /TAXON_ID=1049557 /ORGANISM="Thalassiothrix antarctica, Strain L6-D1" /LENGTH=67 /DNA_ID=CAMNT_0038859545 /DNA_START=271 /DNA_END=471 /DNA_ORIENTATION=+
MFFIFLFIYGGNFLIEILKRAEIGTIFIIKSIGSKLETVFDYRSTIAPHHFNLLMWTQPTEDKTREK